MTFVRRWKINWRGHAKIYGHVSIIRLSQFMELHWGGIGGSAGASAVLSWQGSGDIHGAAIVLRQYGVIDYNEIYYNAVLSLQAVLLLYGTVGYRDPRGTDEFICGYVVRNCLLV